LHPGGGHTWLLQRLIGVQGAAATVLFGEVLDADEAKRCGLVWDVVDVAQLEERARALAARAAGAERELLTKVKATMAQTRGLDELEAAVTAELTPQVWSITQPGIAERLGQRGSR
jgi:enoyl-CoA hydratase